MLDWAVNNLRQTIFLPQLKRACGRTRKEGLEKLKLKDSPGVGYPTLGRPWALVGTWVCCSAGRGPRAKQRYCSSSSGNFEQGWQG